MKTTHRRWLVFFTSNLSVQFLPQSYHEKQHQREDGKIHQCPQKTPCP